MSRGRRHPLAGLTRRGLRLALRGTRLPITRGRIEVPGAHARIRVGRDRWGVVHVRARNEHDAWFGLGFCQAQDRSFQLSMLARVASGRLSEMVGAPAIAIDRMSRRLGFAARAERLLAAQSPAVRDQISAFAAGANAGAAQGRRKRAPAFVLTRSRPLHLQARDVVAIMQLQAFGLSSNWDTELARWMIAAHDGDQALCDLDPSYAARAGTVVDAETSFNAGAARRLFEDLHALRAQVSERGASNAWALHGEQTVSGRPLLANDPHLPPTLPSPWYLCHLTTPQWDAVGASMVGLPGIAAGHNGFGAWGVTAGMCDCMDLFIHELDDEGRATRVDGQWVRCETRHETIFVRDGAPVHEAVLETPQGPLISPALHGEWPAISVRATWMEPRPIRGLLELQRARDVGEARSALARWPVMPLGVVWADAAGDVASVMAAELPDRGRGWGMLPTPAGDARAGWSAIVAGEQMPSELNPERGFVVRANDRPAQAMGGPFLGEDWLDGYRAQAISERLAARSDWDLSSTMQLQVDDTALPWRTLREPLLAALDAGRGDAGTGALCAQAHDLLASWDGRVSADAAAATLYCTWVAKMSVAVAKARAPKTFAWALGQSAHPWVPASFLALRRVSHLCRLVVEAPDGWFDEGWPAVCRRVMCDLLRELRAEHGHAPQHWRWGELRTLTFRHPLSEGAPALAPLLNRGPYEWGGDSHTVGQASVTPLAPFANPLAVASLRCVIDLGDFSRSRFCIAGGQSGNPLSPQYDGLMDLWLRGQGIPIAYGSAAVENAIVDALELMPT